MAGNYAQRVKTRGDRRKQGGRRANSGYTKSEKYDWQQVFDILIESPAVFIPKSSTRRRLWKKLYPQPSAGYPRTLKAFHDLRTRYLAAAICGLLDVNPMDLKNQTKSSAVPSRRLFYDFFNQFLGVLYGHSSMFRLFL